MKKSLLSLILFLSAFVSTAQMTITNTQTPAQLVQNVLLGGGITVSNVKFNGSTISANQVRDQAAYFNNGNLTNIGLTEGVILATGQAVLPPGPGVQQPIAGPNNSGAATNPTANPVTGDPDLQLLAPGNSIQNAAILEFDFVPTGEDLSFEFVFGSEEYPEWANSSFNDVFGFFLSGPGISGPYSGGAINLAIIPGSGGLAVSINNLNNGNANSGPCEFCSWYVNNSSGTTIQLDGFTLVMPAIGTVQCGEVYHIKLAIANVGDNALDSAVFLKANSFNSTPVDLPDDYLISNGFAPCSGASETICTGLGDAVPHIWTLDGVVIPGATGECITITQPGEYCATAYPYGPNCPVTECITFEFQPPLPVYDPVELVECDGDGIFNLYQMDDDILNGQPASNFSVSYYTSLADAQNAFNPIGNPAAYNWTNGTTLYVLVEQNSGACNTVVDFTLDEQAPTATMTGDAFICQNGTPPVITFTGADGLPPFTFTYTINGGSPQTVTSASTSNTATVNAPTAVQGIFTYELVSVSTVGPPPCTNPQTGTVVITVGDLPIASISGNATICSGDTSTITFTGTPGAVVTYTVDGVSDTVTLNGTGSATVTTPALTATSVYSLVSVADAGGSCSQNQSGTATVTVNPLPTATVSGTATICQNGPSQTITFTGAGGTAPYIFTYTINGGTPQTITSTGNTVTVSVTTAVVGTFQYDLVSVQDDNGCSQGQTGSATITVGPLPTATISGTVAICQNGPQPTITFTGADGSAPYTFTYNINGGANQTVSSGAGNTATVLADTSVAGVFNYNLVSVSIAGGCQQNQTGTATVTVGPPPTATISGTTTVCASTLGETVTFTGAGGAAPYTFTYTINGGTSQTVTSDGSGVATIPISTATPGTVTVDLVSVEDVNTCSQAQTGSAVITIRDYPTATISGTTTLCQNATAPVVTFTGANGVAPYLFTFSLNGGAPQTITSTGNTATVTASTAVAGTFTYVLLGVQDSGTPACGQNQSGSVTITVNPNPTATIAGTASICQGGASPLVTFTGSGGTAPYTFTYNIGGGANQTVTTASGDSVTVAAPTTATGSYPYNLVSVSDANGCSSTASGAATITVTPPATATISGTVTLCQGSPDAVITFTGASGTAPYTFNYDIDGTAGSITTTTGDSATITVSAAAAGTFTVNLVSVSDVNGCSQNQSGSAVVTVKALPTATVSGDVTLCQNSAQPTITFTGAGGTAPYIFSYNINGGATQTVTSVGSTATVLADTSVVGSFAYNLVSVQDSAIPSCSQAQMGTATVVITPLPSAAIAGTTTVCIASAQPSITFTGSGGTAPYTFTYTLNGGAAQTIVSDATGSATVLADTSVAGTFDYELTGVSDSGTPSCSQTLSQIATVTVNAPPVVSAPANYQVCDENNDGISCLFDLHTIDPQVVGTTPGLVVQYFETATDAQNNVNAITDVPYCNIDAGSQTVYIRVHYAGSPDCASFTQLTLVVNPVPVPNPVISEYHKCESESPGNGQEVFDLTTKTLEILNGASATVTYHESQADALAGTNDIIPANAYTNISNPQTIWARLENGFGCSKVTSFILRVNPLPVLANPAPMFACSNGPVQTAAFDLESNNDFITQNIAGLDVDYYASLADAQAGINPLASPYTNITNPQTVVAWVTNTATGCTNYTTLTLNVAQGPLAQNAALKLCDPNSDGITSFDLTQAYVQVAGGPVPPGVSITFHETLTDAQTGANALSSPYPNITAYSQVLYVAVTSTTSGCRNISELTLTIHNTPVAHEPDPLQVCDDNGDGLAIFNLNLATPDILTGLNTSQHTVSYYLTQADAQSMTSPIGTPGSFANTVPGTQTVWAAVVHNTTGCMDVVALDLIVNPLPNAPFPVPSYTLCDINNPGDQKEVFDLSTRVDLATLGTAGLSATFHVSNADALAGANPLGPLYTNTSNAQTLWVRIQNAATGCFVISTMDLRVEPLPTLLPPPGPIQECDPDGDGFAGFDLDALVADMVQGAPNVQVTFHETQTDAELGNNAITTTSAYTNITPDLQPIWVRAYNPVNGCQSVIMIELETIDSPQVPTLGDLTECDNDSNPTDNRTYFDLTVQTPIVLAAQGAGTFEVEYYLSQADAQLGTAPIVVADNYFSNGSNPQTIWVRVSDPAGECFDVGSFELIINSSLVLTTPAPLSLCDDGAPSALPQMVFNLTVKDSEITTGLPGYTVTYFPSYAQALAGTGALTPAQAAAYTNVTNPQTLGVMVTSPSGCESFTTLDIRVIPIPSPETDPQPLVACDDNLPTGTEEFDLTTQEAYLANGDTGLTFQYYTSMADAQAGTNMIPDPTQHEGAGMIYIKVLNTQVGSNGQACSVIVEMELIVNPLPVVAATPVEYVICDTTNTNTAVFDLSNGNTLLADLVLEDPQAVADFTFSYHLTLADAQSGTAPLGPAYTNISNPQDVYVRVVNNDTGCVNATAIVTLKVAQGAVAATPVATPLQSCDTDGLNDGVFNSFDLTTQSAEILGTQAPADYTVTYYSDAAATVVIANPAAFASPSGFVYATVTNNATGCRSDIVQIPITVQMLPVPVITSDGGNAICVEWGTNILLDGITLYSNLGAGHTFQWALNGVDIPGATGASYTVNTVAPGTYSVVATSTSGLLCVSQASTFEVVQSGPPVLVGEGFTVTGAFSDNQTITVLVEGYGDWEYSLDNGPWQSSNVFTGVAPGEHSVRVRDGNEESCGEQAIAVIRVIDYPPYFTPNGDGVHDTWNIIGLEQEPSAKIYIFDRYGKLLKQISPQGAGWDGTYNGQPLPSTDYWFTVFYPEAGATREFKAHFSLKR